MSDHDVEPGGDRGRRAFVVVLDACGIGALPDAADYGDAGANTLGHLARAADGLKLPTLRRLGLGSIIALQGVAPAEHPALHGRLHALGPGKDSTAGHWELMGVVMPAPLPTYPSGFPTDVIELIQSASGRGVLCNRPSNGIEAIEQFGATHLETSSLIVYTSQDSVLQIAAHVELVAPDELYSVCEAVRTRLPAEHAVGRVIARPFEGSQGAFKRTDGRRDFSVAPPARSYPRSYRRTASRPTPSARSGSCSPESGSTCSIPAQRMPAHSSRRPLCLRRSAPASSSRTWSRLIRSTVTATTFGGFIGRSGRSIPGSSAGSSGSVQRICSC
jgi:hypothetical protein